MAGKTPKKQAFTVDEPVAKKRLRLVVARKKKVLSDTICSERILREELMNIKHVHDTLIGTLYFSIDSLDEEIFSLKKLKDLLAKDMTLPEAQKVLAERARLESEKREAENGRLEDEYARMMKRAVRLPSEGAELKKLWRKLAFKFHPDLVQNDEEKKIHECMMQKVNDAYSRGDLGALQLLEEAGEDEESASDSTMEGLERALLDIESSIKRLKQKISALQRSEWYLLKEKIGGGEPKKSPHFLDLEKKLKSQLKTRERTITELKKEIGL